MTREQFLGRCCDLLCWYRLKIHCSLCGSLPTWHDGFLALVALGGVLIGVALSAEELFILGGEGLVH